MPPQSPPVTTEILVLGGGIIGVTAATYLAEAGRKVMVIDRSGICEETSSGNAGALAFADILPLAQKGMLRKVPGWLADPLGPLAIPPAYFPKLLPWLMRFLLAARPAQFETAVSAQAQLMKLAQREWQILLSRASLTHMLREDGALELYDSEAEFTASSVVDEVRRRFEVPFLTLRSGEIAELQPGLSDRFRFATFLPGWKTVADPRQLGQAIWTYAESAGANFSPANVTEVKLNGGMISVRTADGRTFLAQKLIIAAGAWSHRFTRVFGDPIPLETERGYNTTLPPGAFDVRRQLTFPSHGFVVTPLATGVRVGGAVELGGLRRQPNFARSQAMLSKAAAFLPGLKIEGGRQWMGYRPSLPDSLPVIDRSRHSPNVFYAFGHGHLGLTQAAATARLIRDLVLEQDLPLDTEPFKASRFKR
ncbi:D-amino-acid dehydrogenase [Nitratireductor aestuarii]|uniref:D-amino-acid dehydrogenase n=1 Tax=Nitratireductor aestuarii TaxID=1735103 RepID=A0A916RKQ3_9HYPH|nr:D-amino-acid dehydrogenase [Nitratireductor aestuarii]